MVKLIFNYLSTLFDGNEILLQIVSSKFKIDSKGTRRDITFTKLRPFVLAHMVWRIERWKQSLHTRNCTAPLAPREIIKRRRQPHCLASHHKLQVLVHREEAPAEVLWSFQILQNPNKEPRAALFTITRAAVLRRGSTVKDDDLVYAEDGGGASDLAGQLKQKRCSCKASCCKT